MGYKMNDANCNSLYERVNKLLVSFEWSDCCFSVSGKKFKAHKLILGISSPVFEAMFYGPMSSDEDISITDTEPEIFQLMLNYIYTDKVEISSIEESYELLYVSRKYLLEHLSEICVSYIQSNMTVDNVIAILNYPDYMQDNELVAASLTHLCEHATYVLGENLKHITLSCMHKILQCENMNIDEKQLIKYVFEWTKYHCTQSNDIEELCKRRRSIMIENKLFQLLRFDILQLDDLDELVSDENNLLLPSEVENIKCFIIKKSTDMLIISHFARKSVPRNPITLKWKLCHRSPIRSMAPVTIDVHNNSIQARIKVNKSVFINSFSVPSRMASEVDFFNNIKAKNIYCEQFIVSVIGEYGNHLINNFSIQRNVEYDSTLDIELTQPLFLKNGQWYTIHLVWPKHSTYYSYLYAVQGREERFNNNKIEFQFEDLFSATHNGGSFLKCLTYCL